MMNVKSVITAASRNAQTSRLTMKPIIAGYLHGSARFAQAKMLPPRSPIRVGAFSLALNALSREGSRQ